MPAERNAPISFAVSSGFLGLVPAGAPPPPRRAPPTPFLMAPPPPQQHPPLPQSAPVPFVLSVPAQVAPAAQPQPQVAPAQIDDDIEMEDAGDLGEEEEEEEGDPMDWISEAKEWGELEGPPMSICYWLGFDRSWEKYEDVDMCE